MRWSSWLFRVLVAGGERRRWCDCSLKEVRDISIVVPALNEQACLEGTVRRLVAAFENSGYLLEVIAVDNGSSDNTGAIIRKLADELPAVVPHLVEQNQGYGYGVLRGLPLATAPWVGIIPADEQVGPDDVVRLYELAVAAGRPVVAKVRRRFRPDGMNRKLISMMYNLFVRLLWPTLATLDVNGSPKLLPRDAAEAMGLRSKDWFLDAEIMIKAHTMGLRVREMNVIARLRSAGTSHVSRSACWEFLLNILSYRFDGSWKEELTQRDWEAVDLRANENGG